MPSRSQIPLSLLLSSRFYSELSVNKTSGQEFSKKAFVFLSCLVHSVKWGNCCRNMLFGMKLSLWWVRCPAPWWMFVVDTMSCWLWHQIYQEKHGRKACVLAKGLLFGCPSHWDIHVLLRSLWNSFDLYQCRRRTLATPKTFQGGKLHVLSRFSLKYISRWGDQAGDSHFKWITDSSTGLWQCSASMWSSYYSP